MEKIIPDGWSTIFKFNGILHIQKNSKKLMISTYVDWIELLELAIWIPKIEISES